VFLLKLNAYAIYKLFYFTSWKFLFSFYFFNFRALQTNWCKVHTRGGKEERIGQKLANLRQQNHIAGATTLISCGTVSALYGFRLRSDDGHPQNAVHAPNRMTDTRRTLFTHQIGWRTPAERCSRTKSDDGHPQNAVHAPNRMTDTRRTLLHAPNRMTDTRRTLFTHQIGWRTTAERCSRTNSSCWWSFDSHL